MTGILIKAFSFIIIIALGYTLKKIGFFKENEIKLISKIVLNITLPAAIINNFANFEMEFTLIFVVFIGIIGNVATSFIGYISARKKSNETCFFRIINLSGYNIGCFTMPYVQSFLGSFSVIVTCIFDIGNGIMCSGGTEAIVSGLLSKEKSNDLKSKVKKFFSALPVDACIIMLILSIFKIKLPEIVTSVCSITSNANAFLSMLMLGTMFEIQIQKNKVKELSFILLTRYGISAILSAGIYFLAPFSLEIRQVLSIVLFAPIAAMAPVYTERNNGDYELASLINSISIFISLIVMTTLILIMGLYK